jgi:fructan beta-fructosidase
MKPMYLVILVSLLWSCNSTSRLNPFHEQHRLLFHFSPPEKWMNDPNGLVYDNGQYHLFYQYYPDSTVWGPMHWGHAVSNDLIHWTNLPVALFPDSLGYIFSGSAVVDRDNTSGLQTGNDPPIIAIFTQHNESKRRRGSMEFQYQSLAFSNDKGSTFTKYTNNPVLLNPGERNFRDPKVIWHQNSRKWIMVLAAGQRVQFYRSANLLKWEYLSDFGIDAGAHGGVWECPDLFPLKIKDTTKWILLVSINPGGPNGGSCTQYFVGDFDGTSFTNDNSKETELWLDYGPDNYAGVTWSDIPPEDGRRIYIGWMNNWVYARQVPTAKWRGAMTLPRSLALRATPVGLRLNSQPVKELLAIREKQADIELKPDTAYKISGLDEIMLDMDVRGNMPEEFGLVFSNQLGEKLVIGFNTRANQFYIDRSQSGKTGFSPEFPGLHYAPRLVNDSILSMHLFLDYSSLELFADGGVVTMTETFFPNENFDHLSFFQKGGDVQVQKCEVFELRSVYSNQSK